MNGWVGRLSDLALLAGVSFLVWGVVYGVLLLRRLWRNMNQKEP
jgi:hypothetical protein